MRSINKNMRSIIIRRSIIILYANSFHARIILHYSFHARDTVTNLLFFFTYTKLLFFTRAWIDFLFFFCRLGWLLAWESYYPRSNNSSVEKYITGRTTARSMFVKRKEFKPDCSTSVPFLQKLLNLVRRLQAKG